MTRSMAVGVALLLSVACSSPSRGSSDAGTLPDAGETDGGGVTIPNTPAGIRFAWVLSVLNGCGLSLGDVQADFTPAFLQQVPASTVLALLQQLAGDAPWKLKGFDGPMTDNSLTGIVVRGDGEYWRILIATSPTQNDEIAGLLLTPSGDLDPSLQSFDAIDAAMKATAPSVDLLAASIDATACTPIHALNPDANLALGSSFKLWVLAALAQSIDSGAHQWTDKIPIQDQYKSLPSGTFQDQPDGTMISLLDFAKNMISLSDNTAADHLLFEVGRGSVEAMLTTTGHHDPSEDEPFLSTRELFDLKLMLSASDQQAYIAASTDQKRSLLAQYDTTLDPRTYAGPAWVNPILIDKLEWFATPMDLCNVMRTLKAYGDKPATKPVYDILSINPGLGDIKGQFFYVGYKGGSEPGVLTMNWLLQRNSDQAWVFLSVGFNDTAHPINQDRAEYVAGAARALLGESPPR